MSTGFSAESFQFLADLEGNNDRAWFDAHRDVHRRSLQEPFARLLEDVTVRLAASPVPLRGGERTMFRINRDVRFSADPSPYNTHVSGLLTASGTKSESGGLVYVHLDAAGGHLAGGLYKPTASRLEPVRRAMVEQPELLDRVLAALSRADLSLDTSEATRSMPRGFTEHADHRHAGVIKLRNLMVLEPLDHDAWTDDVPGRLERFALDVAPLLHFIDTTTP
jgi:uncharacterized protein (TIGR02453 family)